MTKDNNVELKVEQSYIEYLRTVSESYDEIAKGYCQDRQGDDNNARALEDAKASKKRVAGKQASPHPYLAALAKALDKIGLRDVTLEYEDTAEGSVTGISHIIAASVLSRFKSKLPGIEETSVIKRVQEELMDVSGASPYALNVGIVGLAELSAVYPEFFNIGNYESVVAGVGRVYKALGLTSPLPNPAMALRWGLVDLGDGKLGLVLVLATMVIMLKSRPNKNSTSFEIGGNGGIYTKMAFDIFNSDSWSEHLTLASRAFLSYMERRLQLGDLEIFSCVGGPEINDIATVLESNECTVISTSDQDTTLVADDIQELYDSLNGFRDTGTKETLLKVSRVCFKTSDRDIAFPPIYNVSIPTLEELPDRKIRDMLARAVSTTQDVGKTLLNKELSVQPLPMGDTVNHYMRGLSPMETTLNMFQRLGLIGRTRRELNYARRVYNDTQLAMLECFAHYLSGRWFFEEMQALKRTKGMSTITPVRASKESFVAKFPLAQRIFDKGLKIGVTYKVGNDYVSFVNTCSKRKNVVNYDDLGDTELKALVIPADLTMQGKFMVDPSKDFKLDLLLISAPDEIPYINFLGNKSVEEALEIEGDWVESDLQFTPRLLYIGMNPEIVGSAAELLVQSGILHVVSENDITVGYRPLLQGLSNPINPVMAISEGTLLTDEVLGKFVKECGRVLQYSTAVRRTIISVIRSRIAKYNSGGVETDPEGIFKFIANVIGPELLSKMVLLEPLSMEPTAVATGRLSVNTDVTETNRLDELYKETAGLYGISQEQVKNAAKAILRCSNFVPNLPSINNELPFSLKNELRPAGVHNYTGVVHGIAKAITRVQRDVTIKQEGSI